MDHKMCIKIYIEKDSQKDIIHNLLQNIVSLNMKHEDANIVWETHGEIISSDIKYDIGRQRAPERKMAH